MLPLALFNRSPTARPLPICRSRPFGSTLVGMAMVLLGAPAIPLLATPLISEFFAAGQDVVLDDDDDYPDWVELHNPTSEPYALTEHFLTDDPADLTKWEFPRGQTLQPDDRLVVYASRKDRINIFQAAIHTNFSLASDDGFLALVSPDGETILHHWSDYPRQRVGISYGLDSNGIEGYFDTATPGAENPLAVPSVVKDTQFSVDRGFYNEPIELSISSATDGASIYYTLDGSHPTPDSGTLFVDPIAIDSTTIVRALAVKEGMISTNIDTHTYLYLSSVLTQPDDPGEFPQRWGSVPADYAFDTSVGTTEEFEAALLGYPTISLVMPIDSWFDPSRVDGEGGIYANSLARGVEWEKAVSAEFINFEGSRNTQVDCGIRVYGNASRQTSRPKHNMRLAFRSRYGPAKLDFPVFGMGKATGINGLLFNGQNGDSWFHPNLGQRQAASYIRDHFAHELLGEMGHLTPPQSRAHLYVNGLYWGFYQTVERVDHHFMARLLGGEPEEYDSMKASIQEGPTLVAGNTRAYEKMFDVANAGVADPEGYAAIQQYLNLDSFIDYMLINFWSGNRDWDHNNWRSGRHRSEGSPWHYFMWDSENIFKEASIDRTGNNTADNPTRLHTQLAKNADYRLKFADHVQQYMFHGGLLTEEAVKARWERWANYLRPGLKAESARWGDHHRSGNPHTVEDDFEDAYENLMETMFPARARNVLRQFQNRDLYPTDIQPVDFSQHGGTIESGFTLTMKAGTIFQPQSGSMLYTVDGTDPMEAGTTYEGAITLERSTTVRARVRDEDGRWGPMNVARFTLGTPPQLGELVISELHYHPAASIAVEDPDSLWSRKDFEFVEIANVSQRALHLQGVALTEGVRFEFADVTLDAGERILVVENLEAFAARYPSLATGAVTGAYQGNLANGGEQVTLSDRQGAILHTVFYEDDGLWPSEPDGHGHSLILTDLTNPAKLSDPASWSTSNVLGGSPGRSEEDPTDPDSLPPGFAAWLAEREVADPMAIDPKTKTSHLVTYALGRDLDRTETETAPGIRLNAQSLTVTLRPEAATWPLEAEGSPDLQTWRTTNIGLEKKPAQGTPNRHSWTRSSEASVSYYRIRITLP